jgi:hypothetical protein
MHITDQMVSAAKAAAPDVPSETVLAILQAAMPDAQHQQLAALCRGVARLVAVLDTPQQPAHQALLQSNELSVLCRGVARLLEVVDTPRNPARQALLQVAAL